MHGNGMKSGNRKVTEKELIKALILVGYMTAIFYVSHAYSKIIAALLFIPIIIIVVRGFRKIPKESKQNIAKEYQKSLFGRISTIIGYLVLGYIAFVLIKSFFK